ncbi:hypothetical protein, partial [uncultured Rothia sp.]|uniref:hypothetical protein n=1 Tax=uncultured Rothia sp. TaxID=316088 RepID=UPI0025E37146
PTTGNAPFFRVFILAESHKKPHSSPPEANTYLQAEEETRRYYRDVYHFCLPNTNITRKCRPAPPNQQVGRLYETQGKTHSPTLERFRTQGNRPST